MNDALQGRLNSNKTILARLSFMRILLTFLLLGSFQVQAQTEQKILDSLYREIEFLIGDEWFLERTQDGFSVTYCRTCQEKWKAYEDTTFPAGIIHPRVMSARSRPSFFEPEFIDSISYYTLVSSYNPAFGNYTPEEKINYFREFYKANAILKFDVTFSDKWSDKKIGHVLSKNNQLKDSILSKPLYKTSMNIFSDYRYWVPEERFRERTKGLNFYFERLPYESMIIDESIFIEHNQPFYFGLPMFVDRNDPEYYDNPKNELEDERARTLKIIAMVLGIHDYKIIE